MKQKLGAVARGFAVTALSGLLAAGGCISQRANQSETTNRTAAVHTSRFGIDPSRALAIVRGLTSNATPRTRYLGPADPAYSTTSTNDETNGAGVANVAANNVPAVAQNLTPPIGGPAYYVGTTGVAVDAGVAGTNLTGTAIVPRTVAALGSTVVGGLAPGAGVIAVGPNVPAASATAGTTGTAAATVGGTAGNLAPVGSATGSVGTTAGVAGTVTAPGVAGPISNQTLTAVAPMGTPAATPDTTTTATAPALINGAGVAGTVTAPGVAGPVSSQTLTARAPLANAGTPQTVITPQVKAATTAQTTIANGRGGTRVTIRLRPPATARSNATVRASSSTSTGARVLLGATPISATRSGSGRVVMTNQTVQANQQ